MMDFILEAWTGSYIELAGALWKFGAGQAWQPGQKLKLLFAGYNGTRNTGSDVRVEEMLRQIRHILGEENVALSVMTFDPSRSRNYFAGTAQVQLPMIFPPFLFSEVRKHHGVITCEGSMFKSKFANALSTMAIGSLGIASSENKISIGYGGEAGAMDPMLEKMCAHDCRRSLIITRNQESQSVLSRLGVPTELGTDTAWTFEPHPADYGVKALCDAGWDGKTPVLALCPINPFWWPVKPSLAKWFARNLLARTRIATTVPSISTTRGPRWMPPTQNIFRPLREPWTHFGPRETFSLCLWPWNGWMPGHARRSRRNLAECRCLLPTRTKCTN